uniref:Ig-like domain-containing protein n=1 Tax=Sander lucioperca TaxID=283035 RepID=A0A8C9X5X8_SANLU
MKQSLITALILCSISWISVSSSESHTETVEGRPGGEVTLTCSNPSIRDTPTFWLRVFNRTKASWISTMTGSTGKPLYSNGIQNGRFNMSTNISTLSLQIKHVDVSDSGLYLCGFYIEGRYDFSAIHLNV